MDYTSVFIDNDLAPDDSGDLIYKFYFDILGKNSLLPLYEFFIRLLELTRKNHLAPILGFYELLNDNEKKHKQVRFTTE